MLRCRWGDQKELRKKLPKDTAFQGYCYTFTDKRGNLRNDNPAIMRQDARGAKRIHLPKALSRDTRGRRRKGAEIANWAGMQPNCGITWPTPACYDILKLNNCCTELDDAITAKLKEACGC
jgi:hypothetical protein